MTTTPHARRTITLSDIRDGRIPADLQGVRWADGTVECRFNISSDDYEERVVEEGGIARTVGVVLADDPVDCDSCASKCSAD